MTMHARILAVAALTPLLITADAPVLSRSQIEQVQQAVSKEMARQTVPGVSVSIGNDRGVWTEGFGLADLENSVPVIDLTSIRLGSISKTVTATGLLQMFEQGRIDLDAAIQRYVPSFPQKPWPVTIRELLCHQAGIRHYRDGEMSSTQHYKDVLAPLKIFQDDPLLFEPRTQFFYTTYGYNLLGAALASAAGTSYMEYVREHIFQPAGMEHIAMDDSSAIIPHRSRGYTLSDNGAVLNCGLADTSNKVPGGGLTSPSEDLVRFALALGSGKLLKPKTVDMMSTAQVLRDGTPTKYGLGLMLYQIAGRTAIGHGGAQQGTSTQLVLFPAEKLAIVVMCNRDGAKPIDFVSEIAKAVLP
jgi:CubicO group peptidase (beta-lactamase class C family)